MKHLERTHVGEVYAQTRFAACATSMILLLLQGSCGSSGKPSEAMVDVKNKLSTTLTDLDKASTFGHKLHVKSVDIEPPSKRFTDNVAALKSTLEKTEKIMYELSCMLKFGKDVAGKPLTIESAKKTQRGAAEAMQELMDYTKSIKAMWPKK